MGYRNYDSGLQNLGFRVWGFIGITAATGIYSLIPSSEADGKGPNLEASNWNIRSTYNLSSHLISKNLGAGTGTQPSTPSNPEPTTAADHPRNPKPLPGSICPFAISVLLLFDSPLVVYDLTFSFIKAI